MRRMDEVIYNKAAGTVDVGAGNLWDNVYGKLDGTGVTVLGGRVSSALLSFLAHEVEVY